MKDNKKTNQNIKSKAAVKTTKVDERAILAMEHEDIKNSVLVLSLTVNLFIFAAWVTMMSSTDAAHSIATALYNL